MDRVKRARRTVRSAFTRVLTSLIVAIENDVPERTELQSYFALLKDKTNELEEFNTKMIDLMVDADATEDELEAEVICADEYRMKYHKAKVDVTRIIDATQQRNVQLVQQDLLIGAPPTNNMPLDNRRGFKLPKIELKKFNGDVREWLQFWSQYKNIHEDVSITREDKFQYLIQTMVTDSRASELVNSYPPTAENYDKVIKSLKSRFGKDELLVEVYVRELLKLVLNNALSPKEKVSLASVYDKLETHIRSLESLGVTTDTCAAMLYPLVESSLPEELLRTWQRQTSNAIQFAAREPGNNAPVVPNPKDRLAHLMTFLQAEVENEERIAMAVSGFGIGKEQVKEKGKKKPKSESNNETPTAAALLTTKEVRTSACIFCSEGHDSSQCEKARKMSLEESQEVVKQKNACFNCLKTGHGRRFCKYKQKCAWCGRFHVLLMCREITSEKPIMTKQGEGPSKSPAESSLANLSYNNEIFLQTLRVKIHHQGEPRIVRAVLDTGSHRSYVLRQTVEELGYEEVGRQSIIHLLFGGAKTEAQEHKAYCIRLRSLDDSYACNFVALDQETICHSISGISKGPWIQELAQDGIRLTDVGQRNEPIAILIGADIVGKLLTGRIQDLECGATAIETRLGWTIMGKTSQTEVSRIDSALLAVSMFTRTATVSDLWSLDTLGITDPIETKTKEAHQEEIKNHFRQTVKVNEKGRYKVLLPWKGNHPPLADNKEVALKRLETNTKRLKSENLFEDYGRIMKEWTAEGIVERVPLTELKKRGYYLPHRHVVKQNSTTPLRPVFDASAKSKDSPSLNQCLEVGPNLIELIPSMLLRFREKRIGIISDVKRAFLQISVTPTDRDVLRFLWWNEDEPTKIDIYRHCRVVFGVTSSPFLLGATIEMHLEKELRQTKNEQEREMIEKLKRSFYVDNCVTSVDVEEERDSFERVATEAMANGSFVLRGWEYSGPIQSRGTASVLGLIWDKRMDTLALTKAAVEQPLPEKVTKRNILSIAQKIFDPIGFTCPALLRPKLLLQKLWSTDLDWDTEVDKEVEDAFRDWHKDLNLLQELRLPRWAFGDEKKGDVTTFHVFVDASREAYAAVLYARTETSDGIKVQLIEAKSRVAPMGKPTTPRLELLAATIGARLMASTLDALGKSQSEKRFWSDSSTVLSWIKRENQWATFVWNRVQEIRRLTQPEQWYHVPGSVNPADLPTRGCSVRQLIESQWWEGPEWLKETRDHWPSADYNVDENEVNHEVKKTSSRTKEIDVPIQYNLAMTNTSLQNPDQENHWYMRRFSKYSKILRMMAWILRFVARCRKDHTERRVRYGELSAKEIVEAEQKLMRLVQEESFNGVADPRIESLIPYEDKLGLIRLKTPISNRDDQFGFRHPIVLDPQHRFVTKLIEYRHEKLNHAGIQIMMSNLREQVWIISSRRAIRSVLAKCVTCQRYKSTKIETSPATLPEERVRDAAAFEVSGVDFAGPVYLKGGKEAWICLFTSAVYRAIHLELVTSLSTELFIRAFRRFIARRGRPSVIFSDNGRNFTGTYNLLRGINWNKIAEYSTVEKIEWRFNPPTAAWWGGWWERLVRSVKELLKKVLG